MKKHIPNAITLINLFCGCLAILEVFRSSFQTAFVLMVIAAVADFFDGLVARLLKVNSDLGKQLDSLADVVTFGVVPGFILMQMIRFGIDARIPNLDFGSTWFYLANAGLLIPLFSALRLARFNIDTRQANYFIGMPTPANALWIASLPLIVSESSTQWLIDWLTNPFFLIVLVLFSSFIMNAEIPLISLKFKSRDWKSNAERYLLIIASVLLLLLFKITALPLIMLLYLTLSILTKKRIVQS
jgi:CDP-diacylglycerol---serine O-phosphatidyltransferase